MINMSEVDIRRALESDLAAIADINNHFILTSVATFMEHPQALETFVEDFNKIQSEGLPYLVAENQSTKTVLAYANAHSFRGTKGAYRHTVEITLYCHHEHTGRGTGSKLLKALLNALRAPREFPELFSDEARENARDVKQVLSVMALDVTAKDGGNALKGFYERFGFVLVGCPFFFPCSRTYYMIDRF
jgi:phosphinothricin acetyltransferase